MSKQFLQVIYLSIKFTLPTKHRKKLDTQVFALKHRGNQ
jgi:hypothetical protein